jgi:Uncharacterised protein family (UPF0175)
MAQFNDSKSDQIFSREPLKKRAAPIWRDLRLLVAVQLYMLGRISSDRASKLADVPHVEFLLSLGFYKVFPLQGELVELERAVHQAKNKSKDPAYSLEQTIKAIDKESAKRTSTETSPQDSGRSPGENPPRHETQEKP